MCGVHTVLPETGNAGFVFKPQGFDHLDCFLTADVQ